MICIAIQMRLTLQFDAFDYSGFHWSMALVFIVFTALCAIFQSAEIVSIVRVNLAHCSMYDKLTVLVEFAQGSPGPKTLVAKQYRQASRHHDRYLRCYRLWRNIWYCEYQILSDATPIPSCFVGDNTDI